MAELTEREKSIVSFLSQADTYRSAEMIAKELSVSQKTVYRDLQSIKAKLGDNFIQQLSGRGYMINSSVSCSHDFSPRWQCAGMSTRERRNHLLALLLLQAPKETSVSRLADYYYVGRASIVNDLVSIEDELIAYDLRLVRAHKGTYIDGAEMQIRKLLKKILGYEFECIQENDHINSDTYHYLFREFSSQDIAFVEQLLKEIEQALNKSIKDPYYINIFTHMAILLKRARDGGDAVEDKDLAQDMAAVKSEELLSLARQAIKQVEKYLERPISPIEVFYLYQYLVSSGLEDCSGRLAEEFTLPDSKERQVTIALIQNISAKLQVDFTADKTLQQSLFLHIQSLIRRVDYDISISNPLLHDMKREFPAIFATVRQSLNEQSVFPQFSSLSDDEVSYIAVYFQVLLEKQRLNKKVLIVCSSGVGTSHLLGARVKRAFPEWEIVDIVSAKRVGSFNRWEMIDVVLTTVNLEMQQVPTVLVSALFTDVDIVKVKKSLRLPEM